MAKRKEEHEPAEYLSGNSAIRTIATAYGFIWFKEPAGIMTRKDFRRA